ncbi:spore coat protein X [Salirhabdus euzebyi]|uniref:Spore coat protein X n=1 Tax=Salirhabdus euzebyi TaxID=394506 RepID=A0A841Q9M8_9BACI|nr:spore coat protein [Salirhabdus euzebyi]MBB6454942.1 spore coat protein X [Salirhabdus euzebyi]
MAKRRRRRDIDPIEDHAFCGGNSDAALASTDVQESETFQGSFEIIEIRDSCDVNVTSTDTQVAVSIQAAVQVAIALVVNISIADSNRAELVTKELLQRAEIDQVNKQKILIEGCEKVDVRTRDTDVAVSLQVLVQILVALLVQLNIF